MHKNAIKLGQKWAYVSILLLFYENQTVSFIKMKLTIGLSKAEVLIFFNLSSLNASYFSHWF